jgi:hypothetical protein
MGRSTNLKEWLGKGLKGSRAKMNDMEAINLIQKIGWGRFAIETIMSRSVGRSFIPQLQALQADGHELGLHGGSDHVVWSRRFAELADEAIARDVESTLAYFESVFGRTQGFTSPGFKSDDRIMRLVEKLGFRYHGDAIGGAPYRSMIGDQLLDHWTIPVTICGPRTVPFLEWHGAKKTEKSVVIQQFRSLLRSDNTVVLYGHPCYEGIDVDFLRTIFETVLDEGFQFVTHADISEMLDERAG